MSMTQHLALSCLITMTAAAPIRAGDEIIPFNGENLDGWVAEGVVNIQDGDSTRPVWSVRDGTIVCEGNGFGFLRYDVREFADFVFKVEFRMAEGGNSGIGIRTCPFNPLRSRATRPSFYSYEIQLLDDAGKPPNAHSTGSLYRYVAPSSNPVKPAGEWNAMRIECRGSHVKIALNGETIIDVDQSTIEAIRDKPLAGYVCLQNHGSRAEFRNLTLRDLGTEAAATDAP